MFPVLFLPDVTVSASELRTQAVCYSPVLASLENVAPVPELSVHCVLQVEVVEGRPAPAPATCVGVAKDRTIPTTQLQAFPLHCLQEYLAADFFLLYTVMLRIISSNTHTFTTVYHFYYPANKQKQHEAS